MPGSTMPGGTTVSTTNRPSTSSIGSSNTTPIGVGGGFSEGTRVGPGGLPGSTGPATGTSPFGGDSFNRPPVGSGPGLSPVPSTGSTGGTGGPATLQQTGFGNERPANPFSGGTSSLGQSGGSGAILPPTPAGGGHDPIVGSSSNPLPVPGAPLPGQPIPPTPGTSSIGSSTNSTSGYQPGGVNTTTTAPPGSLEMPPYSAPGSGMPQMTGVPLPPVGSSHQQ
jgi:hypothetical protein